MQFDGCDGDVCFVKEIVIAKSSLSSCWLCFN